MKRLLNLMIMVIISGGCSTTKEKIMPAGDNDMSAIWQEKTIAPIVQQKFAIKTNAKPDQPTMMSRAQFLRLSNPKIQMYVYPQVARGGIPIPGYSTVFPLYHQLQYDQPNERTGDY